MLRDKKPGKPEDDPTTSLGASMLRRRLLQILSRATGITKLFKSNASNLHESESPNLVVSRKILVEGPPQNVVADLNWDQELQLMKVAYEERGTPYHFCREDYQRNIRGIPMNKHCQMMCVGPDLNVGGKHQHAIVTCEFNQQCCGKVIWGTKGNNQYPSVKERRLVLNEAFSNVQHDDKGVSLKSPYYELGTPVNWSFRGQWLSGKIIAHYPGDNDSMPYLVREDIRMWGHEKPHRLIYLLNDDVKKVRPHDDDDDDSIAVLSNHQLPPVKSRKILPVLIKESVSSPAISDMSTPMHIKIVASSSAISDMISTTSTKTDSCRTLTPRLADGPPILSNSEKMVLEYYANIRSNSSLPPPSVNPNAWGTSSASEKSVFNWSTRSEDTEDSSQKSVISTSSPPPSTPAARSRRPTLTNSPLLSKVAKKADRSQSPTRKDGSFVLPQVRGLSERESIRVRRESIVSIDSMRSRDDESHVDIDQLIVDYLSETDEQSDEQMEERMQEEESVRQQSTKDEEANTLARNALEEFETTGDGEN